MASTPSPLKLKAKNTQGMAGQRAMTTTKCHGERDKGQGTRDKGQDKGRGTCHMGHGKISIKKNKEKKDYYRLPPMIVCF